MAKALTANVTSGRLAGSSLPVWLVLLTDGVNTFRWATKATSTFSAWTGTAHTAGMLPDGDLPTIREGIDLPARAHVSRSSDLTLEVINANYSGSTRFDEYLESAGITLEGMSLEIRLVFDASDASWANAVTQYSGTVSQVSYDLATMKIQVYGRTRESFPAIPGAKAASLGTPGAIVGDEDFPDWNYGALGNTEVQGRVIPMVLGEAVPSVPCYLTSAETSNQVVTLDTQTIHSGGTLSLLFDGDLWEVNPELYSWGSAQRQASFSNDTATTDQDRVSFLTERLVASSGWSGGFSITNPDNAHDGNAATYATAVLNDSLDKTDYKTFSGVGGAALVDRLQAMSLVSVYTFAKIESSSSTVLEGGVNYFDHIRLKGGPGAGLDTAEDGFFPYSGTAYNSYSGADDPARTQVLNSAVDPPPSVTSVLQSGIAFAPGDRAPAESITAKLYEFAFRLELATPFYSAEFWAAGCNGREFGSSSGFTGGGRYDSAATGDCITSPAGLIEAILRQEMGETTAIDTASFDAAHTALADWAYTGMGSDAANEWTICGAVTELTNARDCIESICRETGLAFIDRYDGTYGLAFIAPGTPAKTIAHASGRIRSGTFRPIARGHKKDIRNLFLIRYDLDLRTGQYRKTLRMGKDAGLVSGDPLFYLQRACDESVADYGVETELKIDCLWIHTEADAYKLLDWLVWRLTRLPRFVEFESAGLDDIDLELMDTVTVKHPLTDETDGWDCLVYDLTQNPGRLTTTIRAMNIPDLSRDNGEPL